MRGETIHVFEPNCVGTVNICAEGEEGGKSSHTSCASVWVPWKLRKIKFFWKCRHWQRVAIMMSCDIKELVHLTRCPCCLQLQPCRHIWQLQSVNVESKEAFRPREVLKRAPDSASSVLFLCLVPRRYIPFFFFFHCPWPTLHCQLAFSQLSEHLAGCQWV